MANTVNQLNYANTFADWLVATDALIVENNTLGKSDYRKNSGTLFLDGALQANGVSTFQNQILSQGVGSSVTIDNNTTIKYGTLYIKTLDSGVANIALVAHGQANIDGLLFANGSGRGLYVLNDAVVDGNSTIRYTTTTNILQANNRIYTGRLQANTSVNTESLYANTSVNTNTLNVDGTTTLNGAYLYATGTAASFGSVSILGNFTLNGDTVYNTPTFTVSAETPNQTSYFGTFRTANSQPNGVTANAVIRWSETNGYWDLTANNTAGVYYRILTDEYFDDTTTSTSTNSVASANSVYTVGKWATSAGSYANTGIAYAQSAGSYSNTAFVQANSSYARANTSSNTFVGTTGSVTPTTGVISFTSNNGVTIVATSANNLAVSTSQDLRTTATPTFAGLTLSAPLPISSGGTNATSSTQALTNILPTGTTAGYVLTTGGPGSFYWAAGGGGGSGATPGTTINSSRLSYTANGAAGYTGNTYTIPTASATNQVRVYINGVRQFESEYSLNLNANSITFSTTPTNLDKILVEVDGYIINPYYANNIAYGPVTGSIPSSANTIQLAIDSLESRKAALVGADFTGVVTGLTMPAGTSNTSFATTAYVQGLANNAGTLNTSISGSAAQVTNALTFSTGITVSSGSTYNGSSAVTISLPQAIGTTSNVQHYSMGIGTTPSNLLGEIRAANNITAYYSSDIRYKENVQPIQNALNIVDTIGGKTFDWKDDYIKERGGADGYFIRKNDFGVVAQDVQSVFPVAVRQKPDGSLAVDYEKLCALAFQAIKELKAEVDALKGNNK